MKANKHLLLWSSIGTLLILMWAAFHENYLQDWRRVQRNIRINLPQDQAKAFSIQLRQVVAPDVKVTDRCVSCHVGMAPGETGIEGNALYGRHADVVHDSNTLGCTTCHAGQGRATTTDAAHGNVPHWPRPLIPKEYAYAGCGSCHTHLDVPHYTRFTHGRVLFEQNDCLACHKLDGRGGTLRPGGAGGQEGPDLSRAGARRHDKDWYPKHLASHNAATVGPWQSAFGQIPEKDLSAIEEYLKSRVGAPGLMEGKAMFHSLGCRGCHKVSGVGGNDGPDLTFVGQRDPALTPFQHVPPPHNLTNWFKEHFRNPSKVVPGSLMPALGLSEEQINLLTLYMFSLRRGNYPEAQWPKDRIEAERFDQREFSTDGPTLYGTYCAACHGPSGEGMRYAGMSPFPSVGNPDFLRLASDEFITGTIKGGRPGRRMPAWGDQEGGLRAEEITRVVQHLRRMSGGVQYQGDSRPVRWANGDIQTGKRLYRSNCILCHGENGEGKEGPALNNPNLLRLATDTYLFETTRVGRRNTNMNGFGEGSTVLQALSDKEIEAIVSFIRTWEEKK
ncbi:c-type cytochrome [bacterium]|nr:c-type cytochrome [bacterium]